MTCVLRRIRAGVAHGAVLPGSLVHAEDQALRDVMPLDKERNAHVHELHQLIMILWQLLCSRSGAPARIARINKSLFNGMCGKALNLQSDSTSVSL